MSGEPQRMKLPAERPSITVKRDICCQEYYVTVGFYDEPPHRHCPAEVFVKVAKHGDVISGLIDGLSLTISVALQYGVPWSTIEKKFMDTKFGAEDPKQEDSSPLDGLAKAIRRAIDVRAKMVGDDDGDPS